MIKKRAAKKKAEKTQKQSSGYLKQKTHQPKGSTIPPKESPGEYCVVENILFCCCTVRTLLNKHGLSNNYFVKGKAHLR